MRLRVRSLAIGFLAILSLAGMLVTADAVTNTSPAGAAYVEVDYGSYVYKDWGWINSSSGGIHIYMRDYCGRSDPYPGVGCRRLVVDEDIWGYGLYNALDTIMPYWLWIQEIREGIPYQGSAMIKLNWAFGVDSAHYAIFTQDDYTNGCISARRWCGQANNGYHGITGGSHMFQGYTSHNNWLAQAWNSGTGPGAYAAWIFGVN